MTWWGILIIVLGAAGGLIALYYLGRRLVSFFGGFARGFLNELSSSSLSGTEPEKPRSLSSLESVLLPRVRRDFPEYNAELVAERVRRDAAAYYQSGINGAPCFTDGAVTSFLQSFAAALPSDVKGGIKVHRVALYGYDASGQDRMLTYQASVEYADTADAVRQKRLVLKYIAAFSADPASDVKTCNCPNCGAPVPVIGSKNCRYCGAALKTPAGLGWMLLDAREG